MSSTATALNSSILSPIWDADSVSPTSRTEVQQYTDPYNNMASSVPNTVPAPQQHIQSYGGSELYQAPSFQTVAQAAQMQQPYAQVHLPAAHNARPAMSNEELFRRIRYTNPNP